MENKAAAEDSRWSSNDNRNVMTHYSRLSSWRRSSVVVKSTRDLTGSWWFHSHRLLVLVLLVLPCLFERCFLLPSLQYKTSCCRSSPASTTTVVVVVVVVVAEAAAMAGSSQAASEGSREVQKESTQKTTVTVPRRNRNTTQAHSCHWTDKETPPPPPPPTTRNHRKIKNQVPTPLFKGEIGEILG